MTSSSSALALSLAISMSSSPQLGDAVLLDSDERPVDTHAKAFRIAAHIRDAESTLLANLRQQDLARHSSSALDSSSANSHSVRSGTADPAPLSSDVVTARLLLAIHNGAWKHAAVVSRDWYGAGGASEQSTFEAATAAAADDAALLALDPAAAAVLASVPRGSKLSRLVRQMQFADPIALSPVPVGAAASTAPAAALFGVPIERVELVSSQWGRVPPLIADCLDWLLASRQLGTEGIFRLSGGAQVVQQLHDRYERSLGERIVLPPDTDVHAIANLVKLYLRKLPEPLVPTTLYPLLMTVHELTHTNEPAFVHALRGALAPLRWTASGQLLAAICSFLSRHVAIHAAQSSMNCTNLAIMIAPSVLRADQGAVRENAAIEASRIVPMLVTCMIAKSDFIFGASEPES
jgi:hypothetical protein